MGSIAPDMYQILSIEPAREVFKCFRMLKTSEDVHATTIHIICLDAVAMATVEVLNGSLTREERVCIEQGVVESCDKFSSGHKVAKRIEFSQGSQTNMATKQKLYVKEDINLTDVTRLYKLYLRLCCKEFLNDVLEIILDSSNRHEKAPFHSRVGQQSDVDKLFRIMIEEGKHKFSSRCA